MSEVTEIQQPFLGWLRKEQPGIKVIYQRSDRETGGEEGQPDFVLLRGLLCLCIEAKTKIGKLSAAQKRWHAEFAASGGTVHVCRSFTECVEVTLSWLSGIGRGAAVQREAPAAEQLFRHGQTVFRRNCKGSYDIVRTALPSDAMLPPIQ